MQAYLIDPAKRSVTEITWPGLARDTPHQLQPLNREGDVLIYFQRDALNTKGSFLMDGQPDVYLGQSVILNPQGRPHLPLAAVARMVNWISVLMVLNGAKSVIPTRPALQ